MGKKKKYKYNVKWDYGTSQNCYTKSEAMDIVSRCLADGHNVTIVKIIN